MLSSPTSKDMGLNFSPVVTILKVCSFLLIIYLAESNTAEVLFVICLLIYMILLGSTLKHHNYRGMSNFEG